MSLILTSPAFADGEIIPDKYTMYHDNLMPPLKWVGAPEGTASFALVIEDPDAPHGTFRHLALFNIPADYRGVAESSDTGSERAMRYARNDFGNQRYDGPRPPTGHGPHHYHFRLAALDVPSLSLPAEIGAAKIWEEACKHAIDRAELVGVYEH